MVFNHGESGQDYWLLHQFGAKQFHFAKWDIFIPREFKIALFYYRSGKIDWHISAKELNSAWVTT